jgi:hypothetical protein
LSIQPGAGALVLLERADVGVDKKVSVLQESSKGFIFGDCKHFGNIVDIWCSARAKVD